MGHRVAFVGLGVMGFPMAGHLAAAGHEVTIYNRTGERAAEWLTQHTGTAKPTPAEAADGAEFVFMCVGNDNDVRSVSYSDTGILASIQQDAVFVDHTTDSPNLARELAQASKEAGAHFLDAPLSGGQAGADNGELTIMVGGEQAIFDRTEPVIDCYTKSVKLMGGAGSGQLTKMVNQICIGGVVQGLAEGFHLAEKAGLDINEVVEIIKNGAAGSWQMVNRAETMAARKFDYGFAVNWMRKDLAIALDIAREVDARLPMTALVDQFYAEVQALGGSRWDTSSLIERLRQVDEKK
ncbi:MAG: NAD(P)-dependent oxidoreductase [Gammaproteobacteria bacterium]|nr:NAD(P)-dependent oxidoreductase [Gammaproteobacteria bacterium]